MVEGDLKDHPVPTPLPRTGMPPTRPGYSQPNPTWLEHFQGWGMYSVFVLQFLYVLESYKSLINISWIPILALLFFFYYFHYFLFYYFEQMLRCKYEVFEISVIFFRPWALIIIIDLISGFLLLHSQLPFPYTFHGQ